MALNHHPYNSIQDFLTMTTILAIGRKTTQLPYYVHMGDLGWWMFYSDHDEAYWREHISLWDRQGIPCGWSLVDPDWSSFDVVLLPEIQGTKEAAYILDRTIYKASEMFRHLGGQQIRTMWVSEHDQDYIDLLRKRGFSQGETFMWYLEHPLKTQTLAGGLPPNYTVRPIRGESEIYQRAVASYNAFGSTRQFEDYWPRYQRFMRSPVYNPSFDLVAEAPDGQFASFCIIWPDPVNHIGLFEPVGTHQQFQKQGLGRAVVNEGLRRLKACGMNRAMVCVENENTAALQLYQAVGFEIKHKLLTLVKPI